MNFQNKIKKKNRNSSIDKIEIINYNFFCFLLFLYIYFFFKPKVYPYYTFFLNYPSASYSIPTPLSTLTSSPPHSSHEIASFWRNRHLDVKPSVRVLLGWAFSWRPCRASVYPFVLPASSLLYRRVTASLSLSRPVYPRHTATALASAAS